RVFPPDVSSDPRVEQVCWLRRQADDGNRVSLASASIDEVSAGDDWRDVLSRHRLSAHNDRFGDGLLRLAQFAITTLTFEHSCVDQAQLIGARQPWRQINR